MNNPMNCWECGSNAKLVTFGRPKKDRGNVKCTNDKCQIWEPIATPAQAVKKWNRIVIAMNSFAMFEASTKGVKS